MATLDVTSEQDAASAIASTIEAFGRLDVLVNNAGYSDISPIKATSLSEFRQQIETNLFGVIKRNQSGAPRDADAKVGPRYPVVVGGLVE